MPTLTVSPDPWRARLSRGHRAKTEAIFEEGLAQFSHRVKKTASCWEVLRLWFLELVRIVEECGFGRVPAFPCALVVRGGEDLKGMVIIHVDDGVLTGDGPVFDCCKTELFQRLRLKHVFENDFVFLKRRIRRLLDGSVEVDFKEAVAKICPIEIPKERRRNPTAAVTEAERTQLRSLLGEIVRPAHDGVPEFC